VRAGGSRDPSAGLRNQRSQVRILSGALHPTAANRMDKREAAGPLVGGLTALRGPNPGSCVARPSRRPSRGSKQQSHFWPVWTPGLSRTPAATRPCGRDGPGGLAAERDSAPAGARRPGCDLGLSTGDRQHGGDQHDSRPPLADDAGQRGASLRDSTGRLLVARSSGAVVGALGSLIVPNECQGGRCGDARGPRGAAVSGLRATPCGGVASPLRFPGAVDKDARGGDNQAAGEAREDGGGGHADASTGIRAITSSYDCSRSRASWRARHHHCCSSDPHAAPQ
jgi:hypothetical protein